MRTKILLASLIIGSSAAFAQAQVTGQLSNVTRITNDAGVKYENPRFSPDGKQVAFTDFGYDNLYVMKVDGSARKQISKDFGVGYMYQWSADGNEILVRDTRFVKSPDGGSRSHGIFAIDMNGVKTRLSGDARLMWPASWRYSANGAASIAVDGKKIATTRKLKAANGGALPRAIQNEMRKPQYQISFISDAENLYVMDANGVKKLIYSGCALVPSLSPDGKKVAFITGTDDLIVMNVNGTGLVKYGKAFNPQWVNANQLIYERTTDDGHDYKTGELYLLNLDTRAEKALTATPGRIEMNPALSADGKKLLFTSFNDGQVYIADLK